jgi:hypothetical protein
VAGVGNPPICRGMRAGLLPRQRCHQNSARRPFRRLQSGSGGSISAPAPVAQLEERQPSKLLVAGSSPAGCAMKKPRVYDKMRGFFVSLS